MSVNTPAALKLCQQALVRALDAAQQQFDATDRSQLNVESKDAGDSLASQVFTELDLSIENVIQAELADTMDQLELAWLGEESSDETELAEHPRLTAPAFWCVDPLDGTLAFLNGKEGYATAIALVANDGQPIMSGVLHPPTGRRWLSWELEANANPEPTMKDALTFFIDAGFYAQPSFAPFIQQLTALSKTLGYPTVQMVSDYGAVMNAVGVLHTPHSFYLKLPKPARGGGALWDFAASAGLFMAAGRPCTDAFGKSLALNSPESIYMNRTGVIFAHDAALHRSLLALVTGFLEGATES